MDSDKRKRLIANGWKIGTADQFLNELEYFCDVNTKIPGTQDFARHLVCKPYSIENLHKMAKDLKIGRHFFHGGNHYDIPKKRIEEISKKCSIVHTREIVKIVKSLK